MFKNAIKHIEEEIRITNNLNNCLNSICTYLNEKIDGYHWVGYYFHNKSKQELELRSFSANKTMYISKAKKAYLINISKSKNQKGIIQYIKNTGINLDR